MTGAIINRDKSGGLWFGALKGVCLYEPFLSKYGTVKIVSVSSSHDLLLEMNRPNIRVKLEVVVFRCPGGMLKRKEEVCASHSDPIFPSVILFNKLKGFSLYWEGGQVAKISREIC